MNYTPETYERLLGILKARGYRFIGYNERFSVEDEPKAIYLRHDIDYSPEWALAFAQINANQGVSGTFFFQTRSPIYNLLAYPTLEVLAKIAALGQKIGLHYTIGEAVNEHALPELVIEEYRHAKEHFREMLPVFSWHNPSLAPHILEKGMDMAFPGLTCTYSRYFLDEVKYCADSNLRYTVGELEQLIEAGYSRLQLLFHPFQWMAQGKDMQEVLAKTWVQVIREREKEFINNHIYRGLFPEGVPGAWLDTLAKEINEFDRKPE